MTSCIVVRTDAQGEEPKFAAIPKDNVAMLLNEAAAPGCIVILKACGDPDLAFIPVQESVLEVMKLLDWTFEETP